MDKPSSEMWACLCDGKGRVRHDLLRSVIEDNRRRCEEGASEQLIVAIAKSLDRSMESGRKMKQRLKESGGRGNCENHNGLA